MGLYYDIEENSQEVLQKVPESFWLLYVTVFRIVLKSYAASILVDKEGNLRKMCTNTGIQLEASLTKSLHFLTFQYGMSRYTVHISTNWLNL
jgi:hypothetical protein